MHHVYADVMNALEKSSAVQKNPEKVECILEDCLEHLKECNHKEFEKILMELHDLVYDGRMSIPLAKHIVSKMENKDPKHPKGEYWSYEEVEELIKEHKIPIMQEEIPAYYFVVNMARSDYFNPELKEDEELFYCNLAKDFLHDKDIDDNKSKAFDYAYHIIKGY